MSLGPLEIKADNKNRGVTVPTEMIITQNVTTLGNPEWNQRWSTGVWNESQVAFRTSYGLPEVVHRFTRD